MSVMAAENRSYVYNEYAETVSAPSGYTFTKIILGSQLGIGDFNSPEDVFVDENNIYKAIITEPFHSNGAMKFWR